MGVGRDDEVHLVVSPGMVHAVYRRRVSAETHARCITGAEPVSMMIRDQVPPEIVDDIQSDDWEDEDTPVVDMTQEMLGSADGRSSDEITTRPRIKSPSRPDRETGED